MSIRLLVTLCLSLFAFQLHAESIRTQTGYYYPVGTDNLQVSSCGRWLMKPDKDYDGSNIPDGCYPPGNQGPVYHIGVDLIAGYGTPVRAIADGKVKPWSRSGWGTGNIGLLIEHESAEYGSFTALYGHIRSSDAKSAGSVVRAGETIGEIGHWSNGEHLHFGIVHPKLDNPIVSGYGMWVWEKYGKAVVLNGKGYYDNGLIDPIDFMVHSGPDNYMSRFPYVIPNPITTESAWFYDLCYIANTPDARCSSQSIQFYFECVGENWPGCAVDPSVWSAVGETGKTSANTYGVGGDGYIPPQDPQPNDPVNLTQDTDILGADGNELYAGRDGFLHGMKAKVRVAVKAKGGNAGNWKTKRSSSVILIKYLVSANDGPWNVWNVGVITIAKLDEGQTITETKEYTIPSGISSIAFRTEIDYRDEVEEYDEGDNMSRVERFEVSNLRPNLVPTDVFFTSASDGTRYISGATLLEDQMWHPHCEIANLGQIASPIQTVVSHRMDGQERDTDSLSAGDPALGSIATEVVWSMWKLGDTGTRTYTCCVDSKNQLPELNEGDNCKSATYNVVPYKSDLIVSDLYLITSGGQVVRNGTSIPENSTVHPYCVATNQGNRNTRNGIRLRYEVDAGNYRGDDGLDAGDLKVGASKTEYMSDGFRLGDTGTRTYRCCVDYQGSESELNESNNCATIGFTVYPTAPAITITDLWVDYDGKVVRNGGTGSKGKRYHPNVTFTNTGNRGMSCGAEAKYYINSNSYRDRDGIDNLGIGQSGHERVENDNIKLGDGGWRSYRVTIQSNCGEFPTVERTMSFYVK